MEPAEIAIIGGGPGGLALAHYLEKRCRHPIRVTIFEATGRIGGKILTERFEATGATYEAGAAELYDYSHLGEDPLREMITELGLETKPMSGATVVLRDQFLRTGADVRQAFGDAAADALRAFRRRCRRAISPAEYYESDWKLDNDDPLSHHSFRAVLAKIPDETARRYVQIAVHSDLATEPHLTSGTYGIQNYLINEPDYMRLYTIVGGIEQLPQRLAATLQATIQLRRPVTRVEKAGPELYRVAYRNGDAVESRTFDFVAAALPNNWLPAIEWAGPALAKAMHAHHAYYDYPAHYLRATLRFETAFWRPIVDASWFVSDAFEGCCVYDESSRNGAPGGVLGWLLAGEAAINISNFTDAEILERMLDSLPSALRFGRAQFVEGRVRRWLGTVNGLPGGNPARDPDSRHIPEPTEHPGLFVMGDYLFDSTLNGVLDSADVVAEWIREELDE